VFVVRVAFTHTLMIQTTGYYFTSYRQGYYLLAVKIDIRTGTCRQCFLKGIEPLTGDNFWTKPLQVSEQIHRAMSRANRQFVQRHLISKATALNIKRILVSISGKAWS
jgi:hypothetical protein